MADKSLVVCPGCGAESLPSACFCFQCGSEIQKASTETCSVCGIGLPPNARFCIHCGAAVVPGSPPSERATPAIIDAPRAHPLGPLEHVRQLLDGTEILPSERRSVTTLFADIVDSTSLAEKLDPEDVTTIMNEAFRVLTEPVRRYEGTLARLMGDGVLCLFGAPLAHEDDAARACRAALEIVSGVERLSQELRDTYGLSSFNVRVGISTGLAVVGEVGTDTLAEYTAMGDSVNLASRLQGAATPDSILICQETRQQVKRIFDAEDMGLYQMKGKADPVRAYRLVSLTAPSMGEQTRAPFVGRVRELDQIRKLLHGLRQHKGALLFLSGPAGIGKSRLLQEARRIAPREINWTEIRCHSYTQEISYWAVRGMLQSLLCIEPLTSPLLAAQQLAAGLKRISTSTRSLSSSSKQKFPSVLDSPIFTSLSYLLHLALSEEEQAFIQARKGEALQHDLHMAYDHYIYHQALTSPLVLVWEDAHWIDDPSFHLLKTLAPLCHEVPLFIILTTRPEIGPAWALAEQLKQKTVCHLEEIRLSPLNTQISSRLLRQLLGDTTIPHDVFAQLLSVAGGNPFFLEEMYRALIDAGVVRFRRNAEIRGELIEEFAVPNSVQAVIMSRVDRLPFHQKKALQVASVAREAFLREVLIKVLEPALSKEEVHDALVSLEKRGLIQRVSIHRAPIAPDSTGHASLSHSGHDAQSSATRDEIEEWWGRGDEQYAIAHAMIAEVVYQSLLRTERKRLHQLVGETVEMLFSERIDEFVQTLAYQFERGGDVARAARYLFRAGVQSMEVFALDAARECYTRALFLAAGEKDGVIDSIILRRLPAVLGDVHYFSSEYEEALQRYDEAFVMETDPKRQATLLRKKGKVLEKWGRYDQAREVFERGLKVMESDFDEREAGQIYTGLCLVHFHRKELATAAELGSIALQMNQKAGDDLAVAETCNNLGVVWAQREEWEEARQRYLQAQRIYKRSGNRYGLATCYNNRGVLASNQGKYDGAVRWFRKSLRIFETLGNQHGIARAYDNMSQALYRKGDTKRSEEYLEKAVRILADLSGDHVAPSAELWQSGIW